MLESIQKAKIYVSRYLHVMFYSYISFIYKNTSIMCHQFAESIDNTKYHDIRAQMRETENCNNRMIEILKHTTGLPVSKIKSKLLNI